MAAIARLVTNQVFTTNPPLHGPTRNIFARHFMPQVVARLVPRARAIVGDLLDESAGRGAIDFEFDFAERLTARFWGALLGMTEAEQAEVVEVVRAISPMFYFKKEHDELVTADQAAARYLDLVAGAVLRTRRAGGNALVDAMADELEALDIADDPDEGGVMPENIGMMLAANLIESGIPTIFVKVDTDTAGAASAVTHNGTGLSVMTTTGDPFDAYNVIVAVVRAGTAGSDPEPGFTISLDGGRTVSREIRMPANRIYTGIAGTTGITLNFTAATLVVWGHLHVHHYAAPLGRW